MQSLLLAHDQIATKDFEPLLPDIPHEVDEDEESVKIVRLVKGSTEPLVNINGRVKPKPPKYVVGRERRARVLCLMMPGSSR